MFIPDPIELMEAAQERLAWQWEEAQEGVPEGSHRCPYCRELFQYEPIPWSSHPASQVSCYDCMPPDLQAAYDEFERRVSEDDSQPMRRAKRSKEGQ